MKYRVRNKVEQHLNYKITPWKKKGSFGIIRDSSQNVTLVHLMDTVGNVNHAVIIVVHWIFDSDY